MRNASTNVVRKLIEIDKNVLAVASDSRNEVYDDIRKKYPQNYIEYGIAESNMIASAAGLASCGKIPFLYDITNFMSMRAFEFIRNDVCLSNKNVKFLGRSAGFASSILGPTHQGTEELSILRCLPNLVVITAATPLEAELATYEAYKHNGPVYIRLEGTNEPELYDTTYNFKIGKGSIIRKGYDIAVISIGSVINEALEAAKLLEAELGLRLEVINMPTIKPLDRELILQSASRSRLIVSLEEHSIFGGLGSCISEVLAENNCNVKLIKMGINGFSVGYGNRMEMREINKLTCGDIVKKIKSYLIQEEGKG